MRKPHLTLVCGVDVLGVWAGRPAPVEDNSLLRELAVEFVKEASFETLEACGADQAITIMESRGDIAVLFTDVDMPGSMNGLKLAHVVSTRWPAIEILIASGHVRLSRSDLPPNGRFLGKPYGGAGMVAELHSLLPRGAVDVGAMIGLKSRSMSCFAHMCLG